MSQIAENKRDIIIQEALDHDDMLRRFALSLTQNKEDAEDLVQDTYVKAIQHSDTFDGANVKAWVCTIMKNTFINTYRRRRNAKVIIDDTEEAFSYHNRVSNPSDAADMHCSILEIMQQISEKTAEQRVPFEMLLDGYQYHEIAAALQIPMGSVKSRIFYIRKKLMHDLTDYGDNRCA